MLKRLSLPVQLLLVIAAVVAFGGMLPESVMRGVYTFSVVFKELLTFILPIIIFSFVLAGILSFKKNAPLVLLVLISTIFASNFIVAFSVYGIMSFILPYVSQSAGLVDVSNTVLLEPFFVVNFPALIRSEFALLGAIIVGLIFSFYPSHTVEKYAGRLKRSVELFLLYCFIPLLPLYVLGFLLKLRYEGMFMLLAQQYGTTFFLIVGIQVCYLLLFYFAAAGFSYRKTRQAIINAMPSYLTAFGTMSSTLTVPISIEGAIKNTESPSLANIAMPIMANVHLMGDAIGIPVLTLVTMFLFSGQLPDIGHYLSFVLYFCTAMFAVSGIPGGGILVIIPVLISIFDFSPAMISIMTTTCFLLDSFGTAANVMGDGALVMVVHRIVRRFV